MRIVAAAIALLLGCAAEQSAEERAGTNALSGACSVAASSKLFSDATQVTYDYQPLEPVELAKRSEQVVRGRAKTLTVGGPEHTVLTVTVDRVYKGPAHLGDSLRVALGRSPVVTADELRNLTNRLGDVAVTLFLHKDQVPVQPGTANQLASPAGLIVATDCGISEALTGANAFDAAVTSTTALDTAVREAVSSAPQ